MTDRPAFWCARVYSPGYVRTFEYYECKRCEATDEDDPDEIEHSDACPVTDEWIEQQYEIVTTIHGVGESKAAKLLARFDSAEGLAAYLADFDPDSASAPVRITRIDGFGPDSADRLVESAHDSGFVDAARDADQDLVADGGQVVTTPTAGDLAAHEYDSDLEAALDYVMAAARRARETGIADATTGRLGLAESSARLAFFGATHADRDLGVTETTTHLEAAVDALDDVDVEHLARNALQLLVGLQEAVA